MGKEDLESLGGPDGLEEEARNIRSCDKGHHLERSGAHQPNYRHHLWSRFKIQGPQTEIPDPNVTARIFHNWLASHLPIINSRNQKGKSSKD